MSAAGRRQLLFFCLIQAAWGPSLILAQASSAVHPRAERSEISAGLRLATQRGFKYLLGKLQPSGNSDSELPVAVNALVGLAFLAGGYTERSGPPSYCAALRVCTGALLKHQDASGYFGGRMYGHGFATLYLAELYGTYSSNEKRLQDALRRALGVIESSQRKDGGWDYHPLRGKRTGASDTSITVCQTMALRAARNLGIAVNESVVNAARRYIQRAQNRDGGFSYRSPQLMTFMRGKSAFPRSAAGVCVLYSLGDYNSEAIRRGLDYLRRNYWNVNLFPYYAQYYCAQAMFQAGGSYWREYFPRMRDLLIRRQNINGGWRAGVPALHAVPLVAGDENDVQATAMALIVLQLPYRLLPIQER